MTDTKNSRRDFMKTATLGAAGVIVASKASSYAQILGANNRVRVGIVGYSDRCRQTLIPAFLTHSKELNFEFVAVSDIWNRRREEGSAAVAKLVGHEIAQARNNEELYARNDVDAVCKNMRLSEIETAIVIDLLYWIDERDIERAIRRMSGLIAAAQTVDNWQQCDLFTESKSDQATPNGIKSRQASVDHA